MQYKACIRQNPASDISYSLAILDGARSSFSFARSKSGSRYAGVVDPLLRGGDGTVQLSVMYSSSSPAHSANFVLCAP